MVYLYQEDIMKENDGDIEGYGLTICLGNLCVDAGISISEWGLGVISQFAKGRFRVSFYFLPILIAFHNDVPTIEKDSNDLG